MAGIKRKSGSLDRLFILSVIGDLANYMKPGDYISHQCAMFLHGFIDEIPQTIQVVSAKRHRKRHIQGVEVSFIYRKHFAPVLAENCLMSAAASPIAKPALAWLDMLNDLECATETEKLGELAQILPEKPSKIITMAMAISDTVLKRAAFYLAWCGRLHSFTKISRHLSRSPVKLDYRRNDGETLWEKRLKVFFPSTLLTIQIKRFIGRNPEWLIHRNSRGYMEALRHQKSLILRNDEVSKTELSRLIWPEQPTELNFLSQWLADLGLTIVDRDFQAADIKNIGQWLKHFVSSELQKLSLLKTAQLFSRKISKDIQVCAGVLITALATNNQALVEHAVYSWGEPLFYYGKAGLLALAYYKLNDYDYGDKLRAIVTTALVARGLLSDANRLWTDFNIKAADCWGWVCLAEATTSHRNDRSTQAKKFYNEAIAVFLQEKNLRMSKVSQVYLGNLFLGEQNYAKAGEIYGEVLHQQTSKNPLSDNFQGVLLGNLGIVEFRLGKFPSAVSYLREALPLCRKVANESARMLFLFYFATSNFYLGQFATALDAAGEAWSLRRQTGSGFLRAEHLSLLVAISQTLGRFDDARYWRNKLDPENPVDDKVMTLAKAKGLVFREKTGEAVRILKIMSEAGQKTAPESILIRRANLLLAMLKPDSGSPGLSADIISGFDNGSIENFQANVVSALLKQPGKPDKSKLAQLFADFNQRDIFDPLWFLLYSRVEALKLPEAQKYLAGQYLLSPCFTREFSAKFLSSNLATQKLLKMTRTEAGREFLHLSSSTLETITEREYLLLTEKDKADRPFFYDGASGEIFVFARTARVRSSSVQARLLSYLLQCRNRRVPIEAAYEVVWASEYDEDSDAAVVKTTVARLNKLFDSHSALVHIKIVSVNRANFLDIRLPAGWQAVLPI